MPHWSILRICIEGLQVELAITIDLEVPYTLVAVA